MKKGTSLFKALLLEQRIPWRYASQFKPVKDKLIKFFHLNINTRKYWSRRYQQPRRGSGLAHYKELIKLLPNNKTFSLLDFGCGSGEGLNMLQNNFPKARIEGCDFSELAIKEAKQKNKKLILYVSDIIKDKIPRKYDYIISVSVIEHFKKPEEIIKKCLEHTNILILDCPYNDYGIEHLFPCKEDTFKEFNPKIKKKRDRITYIINS